MGIVRPRRPGGWRWPGRRGARLPAAPAGGAARCKLVALGDSLTAGYGLPPGQAFPDVLRARAEGQGL